MDYFWVFVAGVVVCAALFLWQHKAILRIYKRIRGK
jgi:hypothetical protein